MTEYDPLDLVPGTGVLPAEAAVLVGTAAQDLIGAPPSRVAAFFRRVLDLEVPEHDGTIESQRETAEAVRRRSLAENTLRAYRSGVQAWCRYAARHDVPALPAEPDDVKAFLVDQR